MEIWNVLICTGPNSLLSATLKEREKLHLLKVIKSCLSLQNPSGSVERTPSDNKNTLRPKGSSLSDESLMSLRRMKEHTCKCTGAENVNNLDKGILKKIFQFLFVIMLWWTVVLKKVFWKSKRNCKKFMWKSSSLDELQPKNFTFIKNKLRHVYFAKIGLDFK